MKLSSNVLVVCLLFIVPNILSAQEEVKHKSIRYFSIQGGVFQDWGSYFLSDEEEDVSHISAKKLGYGMILFDGKYVSQFNLEYSNYATDVALLFYLSPEGMYSRIGGFKNSTLLIELEYFRSLLKRETIQNSLHFGFTASTNFFRREFLPYATNEYPQREHCICIGAGLKAMYLKSIFENTMLVVSSDYALLDFGYMYNYKGNPNVFADEQTQTGFGFDFLRKRVGVDVGVVFGF